MAEEAVPNGPGARRVFGGAAAELGEFPAVCALLDRRRAVRCSASAVAARWALTAAHCVTPRVAYVKYSTRRPASKDGHVTPVDSMYRHPRYEVEQKDEGRGPDVTRLHHDVGLIRTRDAMPISSSLESFVEKLHSLNLQDLYNKEVQVLGFGRTERSVLGEELFAVRLRLVRCGRGDWLHCVCGAAEQPRGVCSGDSGGPVLHQGSQIGITSMGPVECARGAAPAHDAASVFTALQRYADVINATILDAESAVRMRAIGGATVATGATRRVAWCAFMCLVVLNY